MENYDFEKIITDCYSTEIYKAKCKKTNTTVVVKKTSINEYNFHAFIEKKSKYIIPLYDKFNETHIVTKFVEYYKNTSSSDLTIYKRGMPEKIVVAIIGRVSLALKAIHDEGYVHGDIKPDNILFNLTHDIVYLIDFGLVEMIGEYRKLIGTSLFYSPELMYNSLSNIVMFPTSTWDDIWALGVTIYVLLTGNYPFENDAEIIFGGDPPYCDKASPQMNKLIKKMLNREGNRPDINEVIFRLSEL